MRAARVRVGEVRDPRVISGFSRGTYINPSYPFTYIHLAVAPGVAQELLEFSRAIMRREVARALAIGNFPARSRSNFPRSPAFPDARSLPIETRFYNLLCTRIVETKTFNLRHRI